MKKQHRKNDDAVSPVVGVMLMLVVTIIIAAVVSGFAGGLAGGAKTAPQASIKVKTGYGFDTNGVNLDKNNFDISFEHLSGDPIPTKDIEIITYLTLPNRTVVQHKQTASSQFSLMANPGASTIRYARIPYLMDRQNENLTGTNPVYKTQTEIGTQDPSNAWFGEYVFKPGQVARTYKKAGTASFLGLVAETDMYPADTDAHNVACNILDECIRKGCPVDIKWLHVPSGKYILDTTITLQG
ncbi:MAG TPA: type IV pilin N-terminal domain-containing protein [Methanoregulaceae archaeon]|nr:MAG: type IV pilin N-terminal domain-containing protein [Methanolinea sp.]HON81217.1 type IV pilin N-terminal domain-containing protein [Methanoregulaceae archaeon]HPD10178.1 type IV pilin N-terminal domain-containing protein [Methanoregulaceae archaeon]HRT15183.1 type IV pilin N-terminal domain-containing protein [Methanoregulaceae archaeon]HRU30700.1 type IV pilin N-terminal domain-containing protein [Methanoregulaceae archaeon]